MNGCGRVKKAESSMTNDKHKQSPSLPFVYCSSRLRLFEKRATGKVVNPYLHTVKVIFIFQSQSSQSLLW